MSASFSQIVDLTHTLAPEIPIWPGDPRFVAETIATAAIDGYYLRSLYLCEHTGTHVGAPAHFHDGSITIDAFSADELIRPAVVIDIRKDASIDRDCRVDPERIEAWERRHGRIPEGCVTLVSSGWSERWHDTQAYSGLDERGVLHFPGVTVEAARLLAEERGVIGIGIDTLGIDGGDDRELRVNAYWLSGRRYHIENLASLGRLPATGATLVAAPLKIEEGSGAPARVFAFW